MHIPGVRSAYYFDDLGMANSINNAHVLRSRSQIKSEHPKRSNVGNEDFFRHDFCRPFLYIYLFLAGVVGMITSILFSLLVVR